MTAGAAGIAAVDAEAPDGWDARAVDAPGGHVLQGTAWAAHRASLGWTPRFVTFDDDRVALVLTHPQPPLPGFLAYAPRGPVAAGDAPDRVAARAAALAGWARDAAATILAVDPELDTDPDYEAALAAAGFRETEEIQPSRHRLVLRLNRATMMPACSPGSRRGLASASGPRRRPEPWSSRIPTARTSTRSGS